MSELAPANPAVSAAGRLDFSIVMWNDIAGRGR
jgi:hypothetical protein